MLRDLCRSTTLGIPKATVSGGVIATMGRLTTEMIKEIFSHPCLFGSEHIAEVLDALQFVGTATRTALGLPDFPHRFENGKFIRWVTKECALFVFLKRPGTRGSVLIQLESFFGRCW